MNKFIFVIQVIVFICAGTTFANASTATTENPSICGAGHDHEGVSSTTNTTCPDDIIANRHSCNGKGANIAMYEDANVVKRVNLLLGTDPLKRTPEGGARGEEFASIK